MLRLDDPLDELLPELANRQVLRSIDAPLDDTVPASRPITLRDLLTFRLGHGAVMVFLFLVPDLLTDHLLVAPDRGDEIAPGPAVLPYEVALALPIRSRHMDRALPLDEAHHLRHRVLGWYGYHHVHVIGASASRSA